MLTAALAGALLLPAIAAAEPGRAAEVYGPGVARGETELELRGGMLEGGAADGEWQIKAEASHAFTDWWRPGLVAEWEREGGNTEFTAFALENVFDFTPTRSWPVHFGGYLEYEHPQNGPDHLETKLLMQHARVRPERPAIREKDLGILDDLERELAGAFGALGGLAAVDGTSGRGHDRDGKDAGGESGAEEGELRHGKL